MKHVYTSVDIGSDTIKVVVCELVKNKLNLLAASSHKSKGIKKGVIINIDEASMSIKAAFDEVEQMLGFKIKKTIATVPSYYANFNLVKEEVEITDDLITGEDITKVIQEAVKKNLQPGREMVTVLPIDFLLDDIKETKDPKGLPANKMTMRAVLIDTPKKNIYSVVSLFDNLGIEVVDISFNAIGDLFVFKTKEIDNQIGAVINIGAETTTVSLHNKGIIVKNTIIQTGANTIENGIAYVYKIDVNLARKIKEKFALASKLYANANEFFELDNNKRVNQFEISEIANAGILEILNLAKKEISMLTNKPIDYVIITGGTSNMNHFNYAADEVFNKRQTIGAIKLIGVRNNKYSSSIGNIIYFISKLRLKGKNYSMINQKDMEDLSSTKKNFVNISSESMFGKVFDYFFDE